MAGLTVAPPNASLSIIGKDRAAAQVTVVRRFTLIAGTVEILQCKDRSASSEHDCSAVVSHLNLLADQRESIRDCPPTLLRDTPGCVQNSRFLEYGACTLGKV